MQIVLCFKNKCINIMLNKIWSMKSVKFETPTF